MIYQLMGCLVKVSHILSCCCKLGYVLHPRGHGCLDRASPGEGEWPVGHVGAFELQTQSVLGLLGINLGGRKAQV